MVIESDEYRRTHPLLDWKPIARATDPVTSHESAEKVAAGTDRAKQCAAVLSIIEAHPGCTAAYVASRVDFEGSWKRVSDLKTAGRIRYWLTEHNPATRRQVSRLWAL